MESAKLDLDNTTFNTYLTENPTSVIDNGNLPNSQRFPARRTVDREIARKFSEHCDVTLMRPYLQKLPCLSCLRSLAAKTQHQPVE